MVLLLPMIVQINEITARKRPQISNLLFADIQFVMLSIQRLFKKLQNSSPSYLACHPKRSRGISATNHKQNQRPHIRGAVGGLFVG